MIKNRPYPSKYPRYPVCKHFQKKHTPLDCKPNTQMSSHPHGGVP